MEFRRNALATLTCIRVSTKAQGRSVGWSRVPSSATSALFLEHYSDLPRQVIGAIKVWVPGPTTGAAELQKALAMVRKTGAELLAAKLDRLSRRGEPFSRALIGRAPQGEAATLPRRRMQTSSQLHGIYSALADQETPCVQTVDPDARRHWLPPRRAPSQLWRPSRQPRRSLERPRCGDQGEG